MNHKQSAKLKQVFLTNQLPSSKEIDHLANNLTLTHYQVKRWFDNAQAKLKKDATQSTTTG